MASKNKNRRTSKWQEHIRLVFIEMYLESADMKRPLLQKDWNRPLKPYFTERRQNVFIMRQEMIWRIWRIPAIMMYARRECPMA